MRDTQLTDLLRRPPSLVAAGLVALVLAGTGAVLTSPAHGPGPAGLSPIGMSGSSLETPVSRLSIVR